MAEAIKISKSDYYTLVSGANGNSLKGDADSVAALVTQDLARYSGDSDPHSGRRLAYLTYMGRRMLTDGEPTSNGGWVLGLASETS